MKKGLYLLMSALITLAFFGPFVPPIKASAAGAYSVVMVSGTAGNKTVGSYSNYQDAVNAMNKQNSTSTSVATVYKNGKVINSKYAIFKLKPSTGTFNVYQDINDSSAYTYINPSSMLDTAFIDYNESKNMVQIMVNGFKGWITASAGTITPISLYSANMIELNASGLNFRSGPGTGYSSIGAITCKGCLFAYTSKQTSGGYTWYKISYNDKDGWVAGDPEWLKETTGNSLNTYYYRYGNGNLLHRFAYHTGTAESDYFTNLGPSPTYLSVGAHYYSFDGGIYLYTSLTSMLDDYRSNTYKNALNKDNPNYPYYLYVPAKTVTKATAADLDKQITNKSSKMYGSGKVFKEVEEMYGVNALSMFSLAKTESASGTSKLALEKNNLFGYGAYDSCPFDCARSYASIKDSIIDYAKNYLGSYATAGASYYFGSHQGTKGSGRAVKYASDPLSGEKAAANAYITDKNTNGMKDYKSNTIAVSKFGKANIVVYKDASTKTPIYTMRNSNASFEVYNVPVNVIDREGDFYKIYTDSNNYQYGYVKVSDFNITNNQPVISASDKTINLNDNFDYKAGVSATDSEDGNLTSKITYTGEVNTKKAGDYKITYKVTDSSNFSAHKTVTITVEDTSEPIINASDREVAQYTDFDPMEGVTATAGDIDITEKITYTGEVDTSEKGKYEITYKVENDEGKEVTKTITITVIENAKPEINAVDKTIYLNSDFNPKEGVTASDKEDGDLTDSIEVVKNEVKTDTIGDYKVIYEVTDKAGQKTTKEITVSVAEKVVKEAEGEFYLNGIKWNETSRQYEISGYLIQLNVDNGYTDDIKFELVLENKSNKARYNVNVDRWLDNTPYDLGEENGHDYNGAWFKGTVDLSEIPAGEYQLYMRSETENYYTETIFANMMNQSIDYRSENNGRGYAFWVDLQAKNQAVELSIRDNGLITTDEPPTYRNMVNDYDNIYFKDNKMYVKGTSYDYGLDYSNINNISRSIVLENIETFERFIFDVGATDNASYNVSTLDKLSKKYAWYENGFDISQLPKGSYAIIVKTTNGSKTNYGNIVDIFNSINEAKATINNKSYEVKVNTNYHNRIELIVS